MKIIVLIGLCALVSLTLRGQTITGTVFRAGSDSLVSNASVYFGGTLKGTVTDRHGVFNINAGASKIPLIISSVGYYSVTVTDYAAGKQLRIYLKPKVNALDEVVIGFDGMTREDKIKMFLDEFIGKSYYAINSTVLNLDDIDLSWSKKTKTLKAFCNKPIIIKNKKLGYTVNYFLDHFSKTGNKVNFAGNYIFKEDTAVTKSETKKIKSNREDAYSGSRMQFIRLLFSGKLSNAGFKAYNANNQSIVIDDTAGNDTAPVKYVQFSAGVKIVYRKDMVHVTYLTTAADDEVVIYKNGFYGPGLHWTGKMGNQRIGDLLPFEFQSELDY